MIDAKDLFNINFYEKQPFYGSYQGMNYRIIKFTPENDSGANNDSDSVSEEEIDPLFRVTVWPGPYIYDVVPDEEKVSVNFPFSNESLIDIAAWLYHYWDTKFHQ